MNATADYINPVLAAEAIRMALTLANERVVDDIRRLCTAFNYLGVTWYDTRPMLDVRELSQASVDMAAMAIEYAVISQLAARHPDQPHLVRLARHLAT